MATYAEVLASIMGDLHRTDITAQAQTAMTNACAKVEMDRYWFNEGEASFTVTVTCDYAITTVLPTLLELDTLRVWDNGSPVELERVHWDTLTDLDETLVTGVPRHWAVHHQMLRLYPTPDSTATVQVTGLKSLSVSAWCSYAPTLIRTMAEVELYALVLHDEASAQRAAGYALGEKAALLRRSGTMAASGEVRGYL
jgi:hypothetical protein